ncbi:hypothetical protein ACFWBN_02360 [Streptomyces sp. NPDC059989]|uniref:hypothetical protein n=1 Tax=Streptomyces sp. NPDC059989 TaxID=3347026 RepID=UPI0036B307AB
MKSTSLSTSPSNQPPPRHLATLMSAVRRSRIVTLTGQGPDDRSRLANAVACRLRSNFVAGTALVTLERKTGEADLTAALGSLSAGRTGPPAPERPELPWITGQDLLLVIDGGQHLTDRAVRGLRHLLALEPGLQLLTSSSRALGLEGEQLFPLTRGG